MYFNPLWYRVMSQTTFRAFLNKTSSSCWLDSKVRFVSIVLKLASFLRFFKPGYSKQKSGYWNGEIGGQAVGQVGVRLPKGCPYCTDNSSFSFQDALNKTRFAVTLIAFYFSQFFITIDACSQPLDTSKQLSKTTRFDNFVMLHY